MFADFEGKKRGLRVKEYDKKNKTDLALEFSEKNAALSILTLDLFSISNLQNWKINLCGVKPLTLW